ncbi:MAG: phosphoribosyltransferase family protein [Caldilineaceae bacterium]|nr:phosphoribosyltransferase family protein [Caldilineaceae bacterium]
MKERGYNQAMLLAAALSVKSEKPVLERAVERFKATNTQVGLSPSERAENVKGKFRANSGLVAGKALLLVDDVFTTGATMRECASVLRDAGAAAIYGIALATPATR